MSMINPNQQAKLLRITSAAALLDAYAAGRHDFRDADLSGVDLYGAILFGTDLSGVDLSGANLREADLREADLREADLREADLREADLRGANLHGANLYCTELTGVDLSGAILFSTDLFGVDLSSADLTGANLSGVDLSGADLTRADLTRADLREADLSWADLSGADLSDTNLYCTELTGVDLTDVMGLTVEQLQSANTAAIRDDLYAALAYAPTEVPALLEALRAGNIDGSTYNGAKCACLAGTIARLTGDIHNHFDHGDTLACGLPLDADSPREKLFYAIRPGNTPETHVVAEFVETLLVTWLAGHSQTM